jgi:DNA-binding beta-propeller fold protein YncE
MSNNKDFVVKNAVQIGADTKVTLGTITSSNIDLSTGNYFNDTLTANTTYTISNAGAVQSFQVEVTGGAIGYGLDNASYDSKALDVSSQEANVQGVSFKSDGSKLYIIGSAGGSIFEYDLNTAWDISTASYLQSFSLSGQGGDHQGLFFKPDGTKVYTASNTGDTIYQYSLSTAWDVSTASYDSKSFSVAAQESAPYDLFFKSDGTKMYVLGGAGQDINEYSLSTAWDVSTASYSTNFSVSSQDTSPKGISFKPDGLKVYISGTTNDNIYQYSLSTAWDISTASYDSVSFSTSPTSGQPDGIFFSNDGTKVYIADSVTDDVFQFSTATPVTLTWPTSIEWPLGVTPFAPANGQTDLFTISTDDGGTTYIGLHTADNLS